MLKTQKYIICSILAVLFLLINFASAETIVEKDKKNLSSSGLSFSKLRSLTSTINETDYFDFIRISVVTQPEYLYANSNVLEKNEILKFSKRKRFPELNVRVINDRVLDRDVDDLNSIRKRQDDSFDAAVEFSQPIYAGGAINAEIRKSINLRSISEVEKDSAMSNLILDANRIYLSTVMSDLLYTYGLTIIEEMEPYLEKVKERVQLGITDPIELALFSIKFNELKSKIQILNTDRSRDIGIFEYFFREKFQNYSLPEVFVPNVIINKGSEAYEVRTSRLDYKASLEDTKIVRSEFLPKFGFNTRYTSYDLNKDANESDIRGGIYFSMPIFTFGRGSAKVSASKAKANAMKMSIDMMRKEDETSETEVVNIVKSAINTREEIYLSFLDTQNQRRIIRDRLDSTNYSTEAYVDSGLKELLLLERFLTTEISMLHGYFMFLHQNRELTSYMRVVP